MLTLWILIAITILLVSIFIIWLLAFHWHYEMKDKGSFSGATSSDCPNTNKWVNGFSVIIIILYIIVFAFRAVTLYKMIKTMKTYFSGLIKKTKIHYWRTIVTTIAMFVIVVLVIVLTFGTTRIREIYIFSHKNNNLNFEAYEIILGALLYPAPTNYCMIIVAAVNIHSISFLNLICEVMERFEQIELKPSLMIIKSPIPAKQPNELDGENDISRTHANTQKNPEQEK